jgi:hypothetical protein
MEEDLPHPDSESQYSGTNAHLEMLKDMLMTYNMYDNKEVGISLESFRTNNRLRTRNERSTKCRLRNHARRFRRILVFLRIHGSNGSPLPLFHVQGLMLEIQFPDESDGNETTARHIETINSTHDSEIIQSSREIRI